MASVQLRNVSKTFENGNHVVDHLDVDVRDGEFLVLVGPSGCGKTTALRMLAGLEQVSSGEIAIDGEVVNDLSPSERDIAMVFQSYALYPQMSVSQNLGFGLRMRKIAKGRIAERTDDVAGLLALRELLERRPGQLSGGQRQRVAMGRAMVRSPRVMLMDEPLSNLDAKLRVRMRAEIARIQAELGTTTVYVTHDQVEAMTMADRVAVLAEGRLQQLATPAELYARPANLLVAGFMGSPPMNLVRTAVEQLDDGAVRLRVGDQTATLDGDAARALHAHGDREVALGARPEALRLGASAGSGEIALEGSVIVVESLGADQIAYVRLPGARTVSSDKLAGDGETVEEELGAVHTAGALMVRLPAHVRLVADERVTLVAAVADLHFFALSDGAVLRPERAAAAA